MLYNYGHVYKEYYNGLKQTYLLWKYLLIYIENEDCLIFLHTKSAD